VKKIKKIAALVSMLFLAESSLCLAGTIDAEREALARIINELSLIDQMIIDAERDKPNTPEHEFKYDSLKSDLGAVVQGIKSHLSRPVRMPKAVAPLLKEYSE
jgi:RAQPRD family integrative conjugative element protein